MPGDTLVVFEDGDEPARLRTVEAGDVHGVDAGGAALSAWKPREGS